MLKKAKAHAAPRGRPAAARRTSSQIGARIVAPDLARRPRRVLARAGGRHEGVRDAGEAGRGARVADAQAASDTAAAARGAAKAKAKEMQAMAGGTWDKLEQVFEDRVARALSQARRAHAERRRALAERVDALADAVNELIKSSGGKPAAKPRARPAARQAARSRARRTATARSADERRAQERRRGKTRSAGPHARSAPRDRRARVLACVARRLRYSRLSLSTCLM